MADIADLASERIAAREEDLRLAREAARRAAKPSTGVCGNCDEPIEPERLEAHPHAQTCRECAAEAEMLARMRAKRGPK